MKKILYLLLLIPALSFGQVYTFQYTGNAYYHNQYRGGVGADITLKAPVTDATTVFGFDMKGLIRFNPTLSAFQYHDATQWTRLVDVAYGTANYKPLSYVPTWSEITSKPSFFSGSYLDLTNKPTIKRQETYSGTTIASGTYTVTFATAYSVAPNIQANIINGTDSQNIRTTSITTTGFTVLVRNRVDVVGLLPSWNNVSGATVDVLITEK